MTMNPFQISSIPTAPITLNYPQYQAVQALRQQGSLSRTSIAEKINYSPAKITGVVNHLIKAGIVEEKKDSSYTGGRRARDLFFNPNYGYIIAISITVEKIDVALVDFEENVRVRRLLPINIEDGPGAVLQEMSHFIQGRLEKLNIPIERVYGVGLTLPTAIDRNVGTAYDSPELPGWGGYQIDSYLREIFPYAVIMIDRDVNAMAFGELRKGSGQKHEHFIYLKIGHPISAGLIVNGRIYHGVNGRAGDIGHIQLTLNDEPIALDELGDRISDSTLDPFSAASNIGTAALEGNILAQEFIASSAQKIGKALATLVNIIDPELILIGGEAALLGPPFLAAVRRIILDLSQSSATQHLQIDIAPLGVEATITGIIAMTAEQIFIVED